MHSGLEWNALTAYAYAQNSEQESGLMLSVNILWNNMNAFYDTHK